MPDPFVHLRHTEADQHSQVSIDDRPGSVDASRFDFDMSDRQWHLSIPLGKTDKSRSVSDVPLTAGCDASYQADGKTPHQFAKLRETSANARFLRLGTTQFPELRTT